jgi:predicted deacylase
VSDGYPLLKIECKHFGRVSRGSSVGIVSDYGLDDWAIEVRSPVEGGVKFMRHVRRWAQAMKVLEPVVKLGL